MLERGFRDTGWTYLNLDAGWMAEHRDHGGDGPQAADKAKFPLGMRSLSDELASMGLRFGVYTALAPSTCVLGYPGSCNHERVDAWEYVTAWNISLLKDDGCGGCHSFSGGDWALESYRLIRAGLDNATRTIGGPAVFLSTEAAPSVEAMSARPDLYGNTHRVG